MRRSGVASLRIQNMRRRGLLLRRPGMPCRHLLLSSNVDMLSIVDVLGKMGGYYVLLSCLSVVAKSERERERLRYTSPLRRKIDYYSYVENFYVFVSSSVSKQTRYLLTPNTSVTQVGRSSTVAAGWTTGFQRYSNARKIFQVGRNLVDVSTPSSSWCELGADGIRGWILGFDESCSFSFEMVVCFG